MNPTRSRPVSACVLALLAGPAMADTLPLRHGAYVTVGTDCKDPPNVALRTYDGAGIGSSKSNDCRPRVVSRQGNVFEIEQSCRAIRRTGSPPGDRAFDRSRRWSDGLHRPDERCSRRLPPLSRTEALSMPVEDDGGPGMTRATETVHVAYGVSRADAIRDALRMEGCTERVVALPATLSHGPIDPLDPDARQAWVRTVLRCAPDDDWREPEEPWAEATTADVYPVYWVCLTDAGEHAWFLEFASRMAVRPFDIVDATGLDFVTRDGVRSPWSLGLVRAEDIVSSGLRERRRPSLRSRGPRGVSDMGTVASRERAAPHRAGRTPGVGAVDALRCRPRRAGQAGMGDRRWVDRPGVASPVLRGRPTGPGRRRRRPVRPRAGAWRRGCLRRQGRRAGDARLRGSPSGHSSASGQDPGLIKSMPSIGR